MRIIKLNRQLVPFVWSLTLLLGLAGGGFVSAQLDDEIGAEIEAAESLGELELEPLEGEDPKAQSPSKSPVAQPQEEVTLTPLDGNENQVVEPKSEPKSATQVPKDEFSDDGWDDPLEAGEPQQQTEPTVEATPEPITPEPDITPEPVASPELDQPNLEYEARLYDIYVNFNSKKLSDEQWSTLIGERESETYQIQNGDTLWGISKVLFNDGNYWPKIWSLNRAIGNPHLIQPGNQIRFLLGTESDAPAFTVTEASEEPEMPLVNLTDVSSSVAVNESSGSKTKKSGEGELPSDEVEIPPPSEVFRPVLRKLPPSLPEWTLQSKGEIYDDVGISFGRRPILDLKESKYLAGFVDEDELKFDGEVREIEGGAQTAAVFQYVFVSLPMGAAKKGDIYTVVAPRGRLVKPNKYVASRSLGYRYQFLGEVQIDDLLTSTRGEKSRDIFRALVKKAIGQIETGASVLAGPMPEINTEPTGEKVDKVVQITGGELLEKQRTLGLHSLAFLDGGRDQGLKVGQVLTIRANNLIRNPDSQVKESYIPVGQLKIGRVGERFSTAIVTRVWDAIFIGDVTGEGKVLPPEPKSKEDLVGPRRAKAPPLEDEFDVDDFSLEDELDAEQDFN